MSLRIAFDLDGTLANLDAALDAVTRQLFPRPDVRTAGGSTGSQGEDNRNTATPAVDEELSAEEEELEPPEVRALTRRQQSEIWATVRRTTNFWETLAETEPGIVGRIAREADQRGWEVIFITQRPGSEGDTTQRQSQRWLASHGFDLPSVYVLGAGASRGKVAAALSLDVVVDDRTENCLDVKVDSKARAFLVCREPNANITANAARLGIEVVPSIAECLDRLTAAPPEKRGLVRRLKKMIGV